MVGVTRFGSKLRVPATFQIKHQFLLWWLKHQAAKEAAAEAAEGGIGKVRSAHDAKVARL